MVPSKCVSRQIMAAALGIFALTPFTHGAATITSVGSQIDFRTAGGADWRSTSVTKPLDLDGDNVFGTAGYRMFGGAASVSLPTFISSISNPGSTYPGNGGYIPMDDPTVSPAANPADVGTGTTNPGSGNVFSFTINPAALSVPTFRVELINDNLDNTFYNAVSFRIQGSGSGDSGVVPVTSNNQNPDAYIFEIAGAAPGDVFTVSGVAGGGGTVTIGTIGFDTVPEPASAALLLMGGVGLLARRRGI